jgi:phosphatidylserine decarboxylase
VKEERFPLAKEGFPFALTGGFCTLVFAVLGWWPVALAGLIGTLFCVYFFRDPERTATYDEGQVLSPADGVVLSVKRGTDRRYYDGECVRISVFMSVFNVHVNRFPVQGTVRRLEYRPGGFVAADRDDAVSGNEQCAVFLETDSGHKVVVVQVAGLVARRIVCWTEVGDRAKKGDRFGLIRFGSRLDVYLPLAFEPSVEPKQRVRAGETALGALS